MIRVRRQLAGPMVLAAACLLGGCENAWRRNYLHERSSPGAAATTGEPVLRQVSVGEVMSAPPPDGLARLGTCDFVTSSTPSPRALAEQARAVGAREVVWGREFVTATSGVDFRHETWPVTRSHVSTITRADGSVDRVTTTSTDWYTSSVPYSKTDAWYRYVAAFFGPVSPGEGNSP